MVSVVLRSCVGEKGVACDAFCVVLGGEGAAPPSAAAGTVAIKYAVLQDKEAWTVRLQTPTLRLPTPATASLSGHLELLHASSVESAIASETVMPVSCVLAPMRRDCEISTTLYRCGAAVSSHLF